MKALLEHAIDDPTIPRDGQSREVLGQTSEVPASSRNSTIETSESSAVRAPDEDEQDQEQAQLLNALLLTIRHFFGGPSALFKNVVDPRVPHKIVYPLKSLFFSGMLMFLFRLEARRQIALRLRKRRSTEKMNALFGIDSVPIGDTLNRTFLRLDPDQVQESVSAMTVRLIRNKVLDDSRLFGRFVVAVDGTGILTFKDRHCPYCLTKKHASGVITYDHNVLEAKLITPSGFAFSLMTEFIENEMPNPTKQDCELRAFYRLAERLHKRFPRLSILLSLDGLFAGGPTFALCESYGWKYMVVMKDGDLKSVHEEFAGLSAMQTENTLIWRTGRHAEVKQEYRWVTDITYVDTDKRSHLVSVLQCLETEPDPEKPGSEKAKTFKWVTNVKIAQDRVVELATKGGRNRWKIENEGFNEQKTGGYELEHAYTTDPTAAKVFYFLLQVAHMIFQLLERGSIFKKAFPKGFGSLKNLAAELLEAWRHVRHLTREALARLFGRRIQIRFDTT
jgi:hypothetical protein